MHDIDMLSAVIICLTLFLPPLDADWRHVTGRQRHLVSVCGDHPADGGQGWRTALQGHHTAHHPGCCTQGATEQDGG